MHDLWIFFEKWINFFPILNFCRTPTPTFSENQFTLAYMWVWALHLTETSLHVQCNLLIGFVAFPSCQMRVQDGFQAMNSKNFTIWESMKILNWKGFSWVTRATDGRAYVSRPFLPTSKNRRIKEKAVKTRTKKREWSKSLPQLLPKNEDHLLETLDKLS